MNFVLSPYLFDHVCMCTRVHVQRKWGEGNGDEREKGR